MAGTWHDMERLERLRMNGGQCDPFDTNTKPVAELRCYGKDKWVLKANGKETYYEDGYYAWIDMQSKINTDRLI